MARPTPLESESRERHHALFAWAICLEATLCFAAPILAVLAVALWLPVALTEHLVDPSAWVWPDWPDFGVFLVFGLWISGGIGILAAARVLFLLCTRTERDERVGLTMLGLVHGIACALFFLWTALRPSEDFSGPFAGAASVGPIVLTYLPVACTAHLIYLARRPLFR